MKVVVDCANGATYHIAPNVFSELGADVVVMGNQPNGFNINHEVGSTSPEALQQLVLKSGADVGVGLDGDGDRVILVDAEGRIVNGDKIIYIIARDRLQRGQLQGGVVGTLLSNYALEKSMLALGVPFERARVGDRYVLEKLRANNWRIGGEPSGHVVCLDKTTTGDGIVAALQVLGCMVKQGKSLQQLGEGLDLLPQVMCNISTNFATFLANDPTVVQLVQDSSLKLRNMGRVVLRPSGTEPLLRIMVEGQDLSLIEGIASQLGHEISAIGRTGANHWCEG